MSEPFVTEMRVDFRFASGRMLRVKMPIRGIIAGFIAISLVTAIQARAQGTSRGYSTAQVFSTSAKTVASDDAGALEILETLRAPVPVTATKGQAPKALLPRKPKDQTIREFTIPPAIKKIKTSPEKTKLSTPERDPRKVAFAPDRLDLKAAVRPVSLPSVYSKTAYDRPEKDPNLKNVSKADLGHTLQPAPKSKGKRHGFAEWP